MKASPLSQYRTTAHIVHAGSAGSRPTPRCAHRVAPTGIKPGRHDREDAGNPERFGEEIRGIGGHADDTVTSINVSEAVRREEQVAHPAHQIAGHQTDGEPAHGHEREIERRRAE